MITPSCLAALISLLSALLVPLLCPFARRPRKLRPRPAPFLRDFRTEAVRSRGLGTSSNVVVAVVFVVVVVDAIVVIVVVELELVLELVRRIGLLTY